jgi:hypothetical protein
MPRVGLQPSFLEQESMEDYLTERISHPRSRYYNKAGTELRSKSWTLMDSSRGDFISEPRSSRRRNLLQWTWITAYTTLARHLYRWYWA